MSFFPSYFDPTAVNTAFAATKYKYFFNNLRRELFHGIYALVLKANLDEFLI